MRPHVSLAPLSATTPLLSTNQSAKKGNAQQQTARDQNLNEYPNKALDPNESGSSNQWNMSPPSTPLYHLPNGPLDSITLRELKQRSQATENAITAVKSRLQYLKTRENKSIQRVVNMQRRLSSLQEIRQESQQRKRMSLETKRKLEEDQERKVEVNKLIKDHLTYNKKIVLTLMEHRIREEVKEERTSRQLLAQATNQQKLMASQMNAERANRVRMAELQSHEKRKVYFLDKLQQFKELKEQRLKQELRERQKQQFIVEQLQHKQKALLERLSVSQKFRVRCEEELEEAKKKYHSFYEATKGLGNSRLLRSSRVSSGSKPNVESEEGKAAIFIS